MMTAKDYLLQYKYLDAEISLKQEEKKRLEEIAESTSSTSYPSGSGISDKVGKAAGNIVDIQKEIDIMIERLRALKIEIGAVIEAVENPKYRLVLTMKYINDYTFDKISEKMGYSCKQIGRLHKGALLQIKIPKNVL